MRNLKKFLALVLAMMMVFSLMITVNAADYDDYSDVDKISPRYAEAVEVLTNIGIFRGTKTGTATFSPTEEITRAEMATIIYRVMTGDVDDENIALYENYDNDFEDVTTEWFAPYVNYANNAGIVVGDGNGHFYPLVKIDGYQVLAILLRALGYDQPGEFEGKDWKTHTAQIGAQLHITDNLAYTLSNKTPRQVVAQMTYNTAIKAERVKYTPAFNYIGIGERLIQLGTSYTADDVWGIATVFTPYTFTYPEVNVPGVYGIGAKPLAKFYSPVSQCDVSEATGLDNVTLPTYTNGYGNKGTQLILDTNTTTMMGGQGRETLVYSDRIVYRDVMLVGTGAPTSINDSVGHTYSTAAATATIYGNLGTNGILRDNAATFSGYQWVPGYTVGGTWTPGTLLTGNVLTGTTTNTLAGGSAPVNPATNGNYTGNRVVAAQSLKTENVTISAIIRGTTSGLTPIVGFIGSNGVSYLYSVAYTGDLQTVTPIPAAERDLVGTPVGSEVEVLNSEAINKTYTVYYWQAADGKNNVLAIDATSAERNFGVVIGQRVVTVDNPNSLTDVNAIEYTILLPDNTTVTRLSIGANAAPQNFTTAASTAGMDLLRHLVRITVNPLNRNYFNVIAATADIAPTAVSAGQVTGIPTVYAGDADTLRGVLVDEDTTFFVANYTMTNSNSSPIAYNTNGYSIYEGFKSLPNDLAYNVGGAAIYENGVAVASYSDGGLDVYAFDWAGLPVLPNSGDLAAYVLILNATDVTPIAKRAQAVANYAYVRFNSQSNYIYDTFYRFDVLRNGAAGTLDVTGTSGSTVRFSGLYMYEPVTGNGTNANNAFEPVNGNAALVNYVSASNWQLVGTDVLSVTLSNNPGVLGTNGNPNNLVTVPAGWNNVYLTLTDNVPIYIVNEADGKVNATSYDLDTLNVLYDELFFQVNAYGWIDFIYVVDKSTGGFTGTTNTLTGLNVAGTVANPNVGDALLGTSSYTVTVWDAGVGATITGITWQRLNPTTLKYEDLPAGAEAYTAGTYRAVLTLRFTPANNVIGSTTTINGGSRAGATSVYGTPFTIS